jgi:hypothetical protein
VLQDDRLEDGGITNLMIRHNITEEHHHFENVRSHNVNGYEVVRLMKHDYFYFRMLLGRMKNKWKLRNKIT